MGSKWSSLYLGELLGSELLQEIGDLRLSVTSFAGGGLYCIVLLCFTLKYKADVQIMSRAPRAYEWLPLSSFNSIYLDLYIELMCGLDFCRSALRESDQSVELVAIQLKGR